MPVEFALALEQRTILKKILPIVGKVIRCPKLTASPGVRQDSQRVYLAVLFVLTLAVNWC